jgi:hypothetical protein
VNPLLKRRDYLVPVTPFYCHDKGKTKLFFVLVIKLLKAVKSRSGTKVNASTGMFRGLRFG